MSIDSFEKAQRFLKDYYYNDFKFSQFKNMLNEWPKCSIDLEEVESELESVIKDIYEEMVLHSEDDGFNLMLRMSLECFTFYQLYDRLMPMIKQKYKISDDVLYSKCLEYDECNITAEQLGASDDYSIPLHAPVVELASIELHKSPIEKLKCICTTYDMIYAELKSVIAEYTAETSDTENQIPIVERLDIIPVLMASIIKAKQPCLYSNLSFIKMFMWTCEDADVVNHIFSMFVEAIERLQQSSKENLRPSSGKNVKEMTMERVFELTASMEQNESKACTILEMQQRKLAKKICAATSET